MSGQFSEEEFKQAVCSVLQHAGVAYESEKAFEPATAAPQSSTRGRRCDIYIPETDTAIELKVEANLRGVGQCAYYAQYCHEVLLLCDGEPCRESTDAPAVREAIRSVPNAKLAYCIPGPERDPSVLDIRTDALSGFIDKIAYAEIGERPAAVIKGLRSDRDVDELSYWFMEDGDD